MDDALLVSLHDVLGRSILLVGVLADLPRPCNPSAHIDRWILGILCFTSSLLHSIRTECGYPLLLALRIKGALIAVSHNP